MKAVGAVAFPDDVEDVLDVLEAHGAHEGDHLLEIESALLPILFHLFDESHVVADEVFEDVRELKTLLEEDEVIDVAHGFLVPAVLLEAVGAERIDEVFDHPVEQVLERRQLLRPLARFGLLLLLLLLLRLGIVLVVLLVVDVEVV